MWQREVCVRDRDRFWWLELIIGLVFCAGGAVAPYVGLRTIPTDDPYMTSADYWQLIGLVGLITLICLGGGLTFVVMAVRARSRHRKRVAALRGDVDTMPLAEITPDPSLASDVAQTPLEMMWQTSKASNILYVPLFGLQALVALVSVGVALFSLIAPIFLPPQPTLEDQLNGVLPQPLSVTEIVLRVAGACAVVALVAVIGFYSIRVIPHLFGRPFSISATPLGIDAHTELGSWVHMGWDEMRLLEVNTGDIHARRHFNLYAQGKRIGWTEYMTGFGAQYVPMGATSSEMTLRQAALLGLIVARTGLAPRTLAKSLESKPTPTRTAKRSSNAAVLLVAALFLAGITAADFLLPVTPLTWVNWGSAGSLVLATFCFVIAGLRTALARRRLPTHASPPSVGAPPLDALGVVYILSWRTPPLTRLLVILLGLCLAFNLIPGAWVLFLQFAPFQPGNQSQILSDGVFTFMGRFALAFALAGLGLVGLGLAYGGARAATVSIRADKDGLTTGSGQRQQLMAWSSVQDISWGSGPRGQFAYLVKSDMPTFQISWPSGSQVTSTIPPSDGAMPIGADELAALVAARIGKPIRVREEES